MRDWYAWHEPYDEPGSPLARRLRLVKGFLERALDSSPPGEIRLVSLCAGQGRDVVEALAGHPRAVDVRARLVELDRRNLAVARRLAEAAGLLGPSSAGLELVEGDASTTDVFVGMAPAQVVLLCGIFGNVAEADIRRTVEVLPAACAHGAVVLWTRHRRPPDLTGEVRHWFEEAGFEEVGFEAPEDAPFVGVGAARWKGSDGVLVPGVRLFEFTGDPGEEIRTRR